MTTATPYEILCRVAKTRGWRVRLGVLETDGRPSLLTGLVLVREEGTLEAQGFIGAQNLQEAAGDILAELEREGLFKP